MGNVDGAPVLRDTDTLPPKQVALSQDWQALHIACPAAGCGSKKFEPSYWQHHGCGGKTELNCEALLRCTKCRDPYSIMDAAWSCSKHEGNFIKTDRKRLASAMMIGAAIYREQGATVWVDKLLEAIAELS